MTLQNFKIRTIVTVLGIPALAALTLFTIWPFAIFFIIAGGLVLNEIFALMKKQDLSPNVILGFAIYLALLVVVLGGGHADFSALLYLSVVGLFIVELFRKAHRVLENMAVTFLSAVFVGLVMATFVLLRNMESPDFTEWGGFGGRLVLMVFLSVWICDMLAYLIGSAFGKHKIFSRVSPNKSWEGSLAGLVGAVLTVFILVISGFIPQLSFTDILILGIIAGVFGQVGDFAESMVKRDVGVKDSSNLIPGHGGAWDRLDSLLFAVPLSYFYIKYFFLT
ncbi:MAG: phosphatidate cytidylyltransferase [Candidatus Marinimicrobia bacterium]|nr:phosphatidate cytidylyltransferase [Candidatus Neomarinimicrobiota bacterium]MCF7839282.1 phosphatidate cytidylyltransferase [Candidatus Neomarinimicrobiota bacterium]MCF7903101.1 phosphatidate cytidylyltransferase [Candidatus Neomarinimicrobiota bacterium]